MQTSLNKRSGFAPFLTMLFSLLLGISLGVLFAYSQPTYWKITARFEAPKVSDLGNYYSLLQTYTLVQNDGKSDPELEQKAIKIVYTEFKKSLNTPDVRLQFLNNHPIIKQIAAAYNKPLEQLVKELATKIEFEPQNEALSFALINPTQAIVLLNDFITFHTEKTRLALNNDLVSKWKFLFQNVKQSAEANLGESWQAKLSFMRSVQPLDNTLMPYHLRQAPLTEPKPELPERLGYYGGIGGVLGLIFGLFIGWLFRSRPPSKY